MSTFHSNQTIRFIFGETATGVVTGIPVMGFTPVTIAVTLAMGRPLTIWFTAVLSDMAPTHTGPATRSPIQATGR